MDILEAIAGFTPNPVFYARGQNDLIADLTAQAGEFVKLVHPSDAYCWSSTLEAKCYGGRETAPCLSNSYITVNSIIEGKRRAKDFVSAYQNWVIEFDGEPRTDENAREWAAKQAELIAAIAPIATAAVWSGNKSIHVWVCCSEALTKERWDAIGKQILKACPGADKGVLTTPSSWARYPNGLRKDDGKEQKPYQRVIWMGQRHEYAKIASYLAEKTGNHAELPRNEQLKRMVAEAVADIAEGRATGRNNRGFELLRKIRGEKYSHADAKKAIVKYQEAVGGEGPDQYSIKEALATLHSVYQRAGDASASVEMFDGLDADRLDDMAMANLFIQHFAQDLAYTKIGLFAWDRQAWREDSQLKPYWEDFVALARDQAQLLPFSTDDEKKRRVAIMHWVEKWGSLRAFNTAKELSRQEPSIIYDLDKFDQKNDIICCSNGTVNLRTGELFQFSRGDMTSQQLSVKYNPDAHSPLWSKFIDEITQGDAELATYLQRALGYSMTGDTSARMLFYCYGVGANGKTKLIEAVQNVLGGFAHKAPAAMIYQRPFYSDGNNPTPFLASFRSARMIVLSEIARGQKADSSAIKDLTGCDRISARALHCPPFSYLPRFKVWMYGNYMLEIDADDVAIRDRVRMIPFNARFDPPDRSLGDKLAAPDVQEAIFAWLVQGAIWYYKIGLDAPKAVLAATENYLDNNSPVAEFVAQRVERVDGAREQAANIYHAYCAYCESNGQPQDSQRTFFGAFSKVFPRARIKGKSIYFDVRLREPEEATFR